MNIKDLNQQFGIEKQINITEGVNGIPFIVINNNAAKAVISLYGGQILSYKASGNCDLLFLSDIANYEDGRSIKGGIPVCWPWFGVDPENSGRQSHGFARNKMWRIVSTEKINDCQSKVRLALNEDKETLALWPHSFELNIEILVGENLELRLKTINTESSSFEITQALHTYFSISDIEKVHIEGMDEISYLDKAKINKGDEEKTQSGFIEFTEEVDRIYLSTPNCLQLIDKPSDRVISISSSGNKTSVVWNPGADISMEMTDLRDNAYQRFVCIETANAANDAICIEPGESFEIIARYAVSNLEN